MPTRVGVAQRPLRGPTTLRLRHTPQPSRRSRRRAQPGRDSTRSAEAGGLDPPLPLTIVPGPRWGQTRLEPARHRKRALTGTVNRLGAHRARPRAGPRRAPQPSRLRAPTAAALQSHPPRGAPQGPRLPPHRPGSAWRPHPGHPPSLTSGRS